MDDKPAVPTRDELPAAIDAFIAGVFDPDVAYGPNTDGYGKAVEAMWRSAYVTHEYVASQLGVTGFQHSMSSLTLLGALNGIDGPYMLITVNDVLYPQYDVVGRVAEFLNSEDVRKWLVEQAKEKLAEFEAVDGGFASSVVAAHWRTIIANGGAS